MKLVVLKSLNSDHSACSQADAKIGGIQSLKQHVSNIYNNNIEKKLM